MSASKEQVPFFGLDREFSLHRNDYIRAIEETLSSGRFLQGRQVEQFESRIAEMMHREYAVAVNSCTDALYFALVAAGIGPGDEVLVADWSFVASASCVVRAGAVPVFVDAGSNYNMDLNRAEEHLTSRTRALIFVHLYGQMSDPKQIEEFADMHELILIEDAAQAIGASYDGRQAGSLGLASCISFDPTKPISAPGSGGILLTDDTDVAARVRRLRYHGKGSNGIPVEIGYNSQMPSLTAAVLDFKLNHHDPWLAKRRQIAQSYIKVFSAFGSDLILPSEQSDATHIYHKFVVRTPRRDALKAHLQSQGVQSMIHYQHPLHTLPYLTGARSSDDIHYPNSLHFAETVLSLPIHPFLNSAEVERVIDAVGHFLKQHCEEASE